MKAKMIFFFIIFFSTKVFSQIVYKTPSGSKYHLSNCRMVKNVSSKLSIDKAQREGLSPCKICKAPLGNTFGIYSNPSKKVNGTNAKNRCKGITKRGTRCKHYTSIGNDYCYQHLK